MARTDEQRKKHADYMRGYTEKNRHKINAQRRERQVNESEERKEHRLKLHRAAVKKYDDAHREQINTRARENNWWYDPEQAVKIRSRYYRKHPARVVLAQRKSMAKKQGLPFELTEEWYYNEFENGCPMTGIQFDDNGSDSPWVAHIDRMVPEKGYTQDNCRLVIACYNLAKKHWIDEDVLQMAVALVQNTFNHSV